MTKLVSALESLLLDCTLERGPVLNFNHFNPLFGPSCPRHPVATPGCVLIEPHSKGREDERSWRRLLKMWSFPASAKARRSRLIHTVWGGGSPNIVIQHSLALPNLCIFLFFNTPPTHHFDVLSLLAQHAVPDPTCHLAWI